LLLLFAPLDVTSAMYPDSPNALAFRYALLTTNLNISLVLASMCQTVECETSVCSVVAVDLVAYAKLFSTFDLLMMPEYSVLELSHLFMLLPTSFF